MIKASELTKDFYKTGDVAKLTGRHNRTIYNYLKSGKLPYTLTHTNQHLVAKSDLIAFLENEGLYLDDKTVQRYDAIYARVSTHKQKIRGDLERQIDKLKIYVADKNVYNLKIYQDVASGLNDNRKGLNKLMLDVMNNKVNRIFITYKDRLTRFGFLYLERVCQFHGTELIVISDETPDKSLEIELAEDIISIIHSFSGRLYGMRKNVKKVVEKELSDDD